MDGAERRARLEALAGERDPARKRLVALGLVADRLRESGLEPVLVGGAAVEFYTAGGYSTGDVDLALAHGPDTDAAFADLGFRKEGRFWVREDLDLLFEAPAPAGLPGETAPRIGWTGATCERRPRRCRPRRARWRRSSARRTKARQ